MYSIQKISDIVSGTIHAQGSNISVKHLVYDSRRIQFAESSLFFALITPQKNGHDFIEEAYQKGVRCFIVNQLPVKSLKSANVIVVEDCLKAMQQLAAYHRAQFKIPVIGITGSNGKTIVKEWLFQVLNEEYNIVRSPRSYNSQIGVPLSIWQMNTSHTLAIFEAGISEMDEMERLEKVIRPTIGILTNIGTAHDEGFPDRQTKLSEKLKLFSNCSLLIGPGKVLRGDLKRKGWMTWGENSTDDFFVSDVRKTPGKTFFHIRYKENDCKIAIPFSDEASFENAVTCSSVLLSMGYSSSFIEEKMARLHAIDMRLQLKHAINNCLLVNDSYSADITSLRIAIDFLDQQASGRNKVLILSDFAETGNDRVEFYKEVAEIINGSKIERLVVIGDEIGEELQLTIPGSAVQHFNTTELFLLHSRTSDFHNQIILIKGARKFGFERIARWFERKLHQTVLDINLDALVHNFRQYRKVLSPGTKIMAMVKAFSYGSGGPEIANVLQYHHANYLGVAYADEGVELINSGIRLPVMVMNAEDASFQSIVDYNLEPVIFSFELLERFENYIKEQGLNAYPVHIEIETGMNRLGFSKDEIKNLAQHLKSSVYLQVQSVFSHLAASEDPGQDHFTGFQFSVYKSAVEVLESELGYPFLKHISNSAAIIQHPHLQLDMVRLGIGLYGIEVDQKQVLDLQPVACLRTTIAQIRKISKGDSVSYNRRGVVHRDSVIGTVRIGYADGYSRQFSNGKGKMLVKDKLVPVIGTVCMDMTMIDLTDVKDVVEGDEVIVFGPGLPVEEIASWIGTISYEVLAGISQRVKRIYFHE